MYMDFYIKFINVKGNPIAIKVKQNVENRDLRIAPTKDWVRFTFLWFGKHEIPLRLRPIGVRLACDKTRRRKTFVSIGLPLKDAPRNWLTEREEEEEEEAR